MSTAPLNASQLKWTRQRGDVVPANTGIVPPDRAVIAPADAATETEGIEEDTDTEGLYSSPLDGSALGQQPVGTGFAVLASAAVIGFFLMRNKKKVVRRKKRRK